MWTFMVVRLWESCSRDPFGPFSWSKIPCSHYLIISHQTLHTKILWNVYIINMQMFDTEWESTFSFFSYNDLAPFRSSTETPPWSLAGRIIMNVWLSSVSSGERDAIANRQADIKVNATDALGFSCNWARWDRALPEFTLNQCLHTDTPKTISLVPPASKRSGVH